MNRMKAIPSFYKIATLRLKTEIPHIFLLETVQAGDMLYPTEAPWNLQILNFQNNEYIWMGKAALYYIHGEQVGHANNMTKPGPLRSLSSGWGKDNQYTFMRWRNKTDTEVNMHHNCTGIKCIQTWWKKINRIVCMVGLWVILAFFYI